MAVNGLSGVISSVVEAGRGILSRRRQATGEEDGDNLQLLCRHLLNHRGEASGLALASEVVSAYLALTEQGRLNFFQVLAQDFDVDRDALAAVAQAYIDDPDHERLHALSRAAEAPRTKLFRRINMAPGGTRTLVAIRGQLLPLLKQHPELEGIDADLKKLFVSWFNKGFLEMRKVSWDSSANILEKIIEYEAVHRIKGFDDLRTRLQGDRACYAFFHPVMDDDPLVFVEVAFVDEIPEAIGPLLESERTHLDPETADTVVFYSISNCHSGLAGVSFGNFLIKQVVEEVRGEYPNVGTFVTLSPVPGFRRWLLKADLTDLVEPELVDKVTQPVGQVVEAEVRDALMKLSAHYLLNEKSGALARDPVARFHLGNGARLHRLLWAADLSIKGKEQSAGIMVNYLYDLDRIEANHDEYFDQGTISVSKSVSRWL